MKINKTFYLSLVAAILLAACSQHVATSDPATAAQPVTLTSQTTEQKTFGSYDAEDLVTAAATGQPAIELSDNTKAIAGTTVEGQTVTITKAGTYVLSGQLKGQVIVHVGKEENVQLILNGVAIRNETGPAILITQAKKVTTTLAADTQNTLADDSADQTTAAAFFSTSDLVINGDGTLIVTGNSNGIRSSKLSLISGDYTINTKNNALQADSVQILDGLYTLKTEAGNAITTTGTLAVDGGSFLITSHSGLQADNEIQLQQAKMTIQTGTADSSAEESQHGFTAGKTILIQSGTYTIDSAGDSLHSQGDITSTSGTVTLTAGHEGIHATDTLTINADRVTIDAQSTGLDIGQLQMAAGTLISSGSGKTMSLADSSTQATVAICFDTIQTAGTIISLQDSSGNALATYQPSHDFQQLTISSPDLKIGASYTLISGTEASGNPQNGYYSDGNIINGIELGTLTLTEPLTNLSETGAAVSARKNGPAKKGPGEFPR